MILALWSPFYRSRIRSLCSNARRRSYSAGCSSSRCLSARYSRTTRTTRGPLTGRRVCASRSGWTGPRPRTRRGLRSNWTIILTARRSAGASSRAALTAVGCRYRCRFRSCSLWRTRAQSSTRLRSARSSRSRQEHALPAAWASIEPLLAHSSSRYMWYCTILS